MDDLIEALQIFRKYTNCERPTSCENNILYVDCNPALVSVVDKKRLDELGFVPESVWSHHNDCFASYRFGLW
jgi:hypothetical protein